ncbi:MAG: cytochrome c oxidase subunit II [Proteobacteria bacterium]|nr:cytochrome c oxidase subunit II [Pseudomonadota bacterium]
MFLKKIGLGVESVAAFLVTAGAALAAQPQPWEINLQPAATPVMEHIEDFHNLLVALITIVSLFVLALILWILVRYNQRANPVPSKTHHNTLIEVIWTVVPVIILVVIAIPSFKLLYFEADMPKPDLTIKAIGHQWSWSYQYPGQGDFEIASNGLTTIDAAAGRAPDAAAKAGEPRLLGVDNPIYVPVNKVVHVETTGADVIHSWAVPAFGVKMDAVPGRINHTWFKVTKEGTYYGQCSELCGAAHAFMPIEVKVVSQAEYDTWLAAKKKTASNTGGTRTAALTK